MFQVRNLLLMLIAMTPIEDINCSDVINEMCNFSHENNAGNQPPMCMTIQHKDNNLNEKHLRILPSADVGD